MSEPIVNPGTAPVAQPQTPVAQPAPPVAPQSPPAVPHERFNEVNQRAIAMEAEVTRLQAHTQVELANQAARLGQERQLHVALARAGVVSDPYADYLTAQYKALGQAAPTVDQWVASQRAATPAFFAQIAGPLTPPQATVAPPVAPQVSAQLPPPPVAPVVQPLAAPPPPPISGGANPTPPTHDPPLTMDLIATLDIATYTRRRVEIQKFMKAQRT